MKDLFLSPVTTEEYNKELKNFYEELILNKYNIYICTADTYEITENSLKKAGIKIDDKYNIFIIDSFVEPDKFILIKDKEFKREVLKQKGILR